MLESSFLGIPNSAWVAIAAFVYAAATFTIAWVTYWTSRQAIMASRDATSQQIGAAKDAASIQARASSISNNRQQWINSLRDEVTGFLTDAKLVSTLRDPREGMPYARALSAHVFKVRLLINPREQESITLVEMLTKIMNSGGGITDTDQENVVSHTQRILKTEWERDKSGN